MPIHDAKWWRANIVLQWEGAKNFNTLNYKQVFSGVLFLRHGNADLEYMKSVRTWVVAKWLSISVKYFAPSLSITSIARCQGESTWVNICLELSRIDRKTTCLWMELRPIHGRGLRVVKVPKHLDCMSQIQMSLCSKYVLATGYLSWCQALIVGLGFQKALGFRISC